ncbi:hypothetical protein C4565_00325 [Candidatus Parcubacteria bacterium]|nr:MAG: hypothetical protein C4565_00325 [Candidatus Parcubacteria bacterium]
MKRKLISLNSSLKDPIRKIYKRHFKTNNCTILGRIALHLNVQTVPITSKVVARNSHNELLKIDTTLQDLIEIKRQVDEMVRNLQDVDDYSI